MGLLKQSVADNAADSDDRTLSLKLYSNTSEDIKYPRQSTQFKVLKCYHIQATDAKHTRCKLYLKSAKRQSGGE